MNTEIEILNGAKLILHVSPEDTECLIAIEIVYPDAGVIGYLSSVQMGNLQEFLKHLRSEI